MLLRMEEKYNLKSGGGLGTLLVRFNAEDGKYEEWYYGGLKKKLCYLKDGSPSKVLIKRGINLEI